MPLATTNQLPLSTITIDGVPFSVTLIITHDGIEYIGRLWFAEVHNDEALFAGEIEVDAGMPDRGVLPGRTEVEVVSLANRLTDEELLARYHRARAEKRRYHGLRRVTVEILSHIRYLNQVAVSLRRGLLDVDAAVQEMDMTEAQVHALVKSLRDHAGRE
ncbi:MAG: hypothetical protein MUF00_12230 [Gemmatimonadaceae bacterium]|jgi:hypothetical protein|nr:hypothetical protein [Gemmatimonadaceae bacterium]